MLTGIGPLRNQLREVRSPDAIIWAPAQVHHRLLDIVGGSDHPDEYSRAIEAETARVDGVIATGFQTGLALRELYAHAGIFVLPSSHEGLPIALLEALSYGLQVVASDISANVEVGLKSESYFPLGNIAALVKTLQATAASSLTQYDREEIRLWVSLRYDWRRIAEKTLDIYRRIV